MCLDLEIQPGYLVDPDDVAVGSGRDDRPLYHWLKREPGPKIRTSNRDWNKVAN